MNKEIDKVLHEMRTRLVNNKKHTSPTLIKWAERIEKALKDEEELKNANPKL